MKWMSLLLIALPMAATAQVKKATPAKANDWVSYYSRAIPMSGSEPYYDTTVNLAEDMSRDRLEENATVYFDKVFSSGFVNKGKKHSYTGLGKYTFSLNDHADNEEDYTVSYLMDIQVKDGRYSVSLHNFTIEHLAAEVDFGKKVEAMKRNDPKAKLLLAYFHRNNTDQLKQVYKSMATRNTPVYASKQ